MTSNKEKIEKTMEQKIIFDDALNLNTRGYQLMFEIENILRFFIIQKMNEVNPRWWKSLSIKRIKNDVEVLIRDECKDKLDIEKKSEGEKFLLMHEIYYTKSEDLYLILKENWETFENIFGRTSRDAFNSDFKKIIRIRNKIMHSKPVLEREINDLDHFNNDLLSKVNIQDNDYKNFLKVYISENVISSFNNELKHHIQIINNNNTSIFNTKIYDFIHLEWWYMDYLDVDIDKCSSYYNDISHINKVIKEERRGSKYDAQRMIRNKKIVHRCEEIMADINA